MLSLIKLSKVLYRNQALRGYININLQGPLVVVRNWMSISRLSVDVLKEKGIDQLFEKYLETIHIRKSKD
jgi:hypothetical protein